MKMIGPIFITAEGVNILLNVIFKVWLTNIGGIWMSKVWRDLVKLIACVDDVITTVFKTVESTKV